MRALLLGIAVSIAAPSVATADECLEVGWRDARSEWIYYNARLIEINEADGRIRVGYDFKNGELELKVREKETASGQELIVLRGRWFERGGRSGKVRLEMEKGHHRAKGWYTFGDNEGGAHYDFVLRDCRRAAPPPPPRWQKGDPLQVLWNGKWFNARIIAVGDTRYRIHYDGYAASWDEWVNESRMRRR